MTQAELDFVEEHTRSLLPTWGDRCIRGEALDIQSDTDPYSRCAHDKGWVTKDGKRLTAKGFAAAASFLRR
jgi:hypothetical protein